MSAARRAAALLLLAGCGASEAAVPPRVTMEHGIAAGDRLRSADLACGTERAGRLGDAGALQVVTFATPFDCSLCDTHLAGLLDSGVRELAGVDAFAVMWGPQPDALQRQATELRARYPVCVDEPGALWDAYPISHTPFTVVLRGGEVVYVNDQPLTEPAHQVAFLADVRRIAAGGR